LARQYATDDAVVRWLDGQEPYAVHVDDLLEDPQRFAQVCLLWADRSMAGNEFHDNLQAILNGTPLPPKHANQIVNRRRQRLQEDHQCIPTHAVIGESTFFQRPPDAETLSPIPFLFDAAREKCKVAFEGNSAVWRLLQEDRSALSAIETRHHSKILVLSDPSLHLEQVKVQLSP